jgi:hypothetical protein
MVLPPYSLYSLYSLSLKGTDPLFLDNFLAETYSSGCCACTFPGDLERTWDFLLTDFLRFFASLLFSEFLFFCFFTAIFRVGAIGIIFTYSFPLIMMCVDKVCFFKLLKKISALPCQYF